jgi:hypothetical protein
MYHQWYRKFANKKINYKLKADSFEDFRLFFFFSSFESYLCQTRYIIYSILSKYGAFEQKLKNNCVVWQHFGKCKIYVHQTINLQYFFLLFYSAGNLWAKKSLIIFNWYLFNLIQKNLYFFPMFGSEIFTFNTWKNAILIF